VKVRVDTGAWADASFGDGTWRIAYPVNAPEGRTLNVAVEATDCAGRTTAITRSIGTNLSSPNAPDTTITSRPSNTSGPNGVSFSFTAVQGTNEVAGFACQLDDGPFTPCASPWTYNSLTVGVGGRCDGLRGCDAGELYLDGDGHRAEYDALSALDPAQVADVSERLAAEVFTPAQAAARLFLAHVERNVDRP
jgi:hypothetical protein